MLPNRVWNKMGPRLPGWFKVGLKRIDPAYELQYMPPRRTGQIGGLSPRMFPLGTWAICRRVRGTPWLFAQWTPLTDNYGRPVEPTRDILTVARAYRNIAHRQGRHVMENELARMNIEQIRALAAAKDDAFRGRLNATLAGAPQDRTPWIVNPGVPG